MLHQQIYLERTSYCENHYDCSPRPETPECPSILMQRTCLKVICYIINQMGYRAWLGSNPGKSSEFTDHFSVDKIFTITTFRDEINIMPMDEMSRMFSKYMVQKVFSLNELRYLSKRLSIWAEVSLGRSMGSASLSLSNQRMW